MDPGDLEGGMRTVNAIGDDALQRQAGGKVTPERLTQGTSAQRDEWLKRGHESGDAAQCDTFGETP